MSKGAEAEPVDPGSVDDLAGSRIRRSDGRLTALVVLSSLCFFLLFNHAHFKGSDELAIFEMTRSLAERGDLAVPPLRHTEVGADGRRYSYFAVGQAVLALPFYWAAGVARAVLPWTWTRALEGVPIEKGVYRFGGSLESTFVGLYAPLVTALLVGLFFRFERALGASQGGAVVAAMLLATTTQIALHSAYFLRHSTEALCILGAAYGFFRFRIGPDGERTRWLAIGASFAVAIPLIRMPASIAAPALGGYLAWILWERREAWRRDGRALRWGLAIAVPCLLAAAIHGGVNELKWGDWLRSPMVGQQSRLVNPIGQGLAGLLLSPGSSVFVWSPLLLMAPFVARSVLPQRRAEAVAGVTLVLCFLLFYARFDGWSGLWSAPGPRYLVALLPICLLPLGPWLDAARGSGARLSVAGLALMGAFVQLLSLSVRWGAVPRLAGYPVDDPDHAGFLFDLSHSPLPEIARIVWQGGPLDPWLAHLWLGWPGFAARPGLAAAIAAILIGAGVAAGTAIVFELRRDSGDAAR